LSKVLWRIAADTRDYGADDNTGKGAEISGGRWNKRGTPAIYASETTALAVLETLVHFKADGLPLNRYLVRVEIPDAAWANATAWNPTILSAKNRVAWDALPAGRDSIEAGDDWLNGKPVDPSLPNPLLLIVPSIIVPHECNVIINPRHAGAAAIIYTKRSRWIYDSRLLHK
jgi:RES domain-containing protein